MSLGQLVILCLVAGFCGAIGRSLAGYSHGGCLASIALGFIGAFLGSWAAHALRLPVVIDLRVGNETFPVLWSIAGSALFVAVLNVFTRRRSD
jgi:uncharacterized membrane protein YeaQ/YmgE (transglycosylase-associated protein family)